MLIVANWKAYIEDLAKGKSLLGASRRLARRGEVHIVLAPPAPFLGALAVGNTSSVAFAAQDVSATTGGAETGEVTAGVYAALGATYAIVGHSERRARGDTDALIADKVAHALAHNLTPILCVGEHERDSEGAYLSFVRAQVTSAFAPLTGKERRKVIVAYEPLWAIGKTAEAAIAPHDLSEMVLYIRKVLAEFLPGKTATQTLVLYGGSVEPQNAAPLASMSGIDGFLVGHASVDPASFTHLVTELS